MAIILEKCNQTILLIRLANIAIKNFNTNTWSKIDGNNTNGFNKNY